jgi:hypothetical protein
MSPGVKSLQYKKPEKTIMAGIRIASGMARFSALRRERAERMKRN